MAVFGKNSDWQELPEIRTESILLAFVHVFGQRRRVGKGALLGPRHGLIHFAVDGGARAVERFLAGPAFRQHARFEARDRVHLAPFVEEALRHVVRGIVRRMAGHAERLALQKVWALAGSSVRPGALGGMPNTP